MPVYSISNNQLSVSINSHGAELCSAKTKANGIEYIWQADEALWARHAPNLFPIVGKLKDGKFIYNDKSYELPQHGFARDREFICIEQTEHKLVFELTADEESLKDFPFHFSYQVAFILLHNSLSVAYSVFNPDNTDLYFSVGAHPAFNCPLLPEETFEDYELIFPGKDAITINLLSDGLTTQNVKAIPLNGHKLAVNKKLFDADALVMMNAQINEVELRSVKTGRGVSLKSANWPYFGIWTKKQSNRFVCLEPWHGIADSVSSNHELKNKEGIIVLKSEQYFKCSFDLTFF